ncbi:MAG TPA: hypothetical protein VGG26_08990 [Terracidiphilus sp.]
MNTAPAILSQTQRCACAKLLYRNNLDGTRDYKLKGDPGCDKCRGRGLHTGCGDCCGAGMLPGSRICETCRGTGKVSVRGRIV